MAFYLMVYNIKNTKLNLRDFEQAQFITTWIAWNSHCKNVKSWFRRHIKLCSLKELSCSCNVQSFEKDKSWLEFDFHIFFIICFILFYNIYFCKKSNRRLEFNDTWFFFICLWQKTLSGKSGVIVFAFCLLPGKLASGMAVCPWIIFFFSK
jgi:hypothetical protein